MACAQHTCHTGSANTITLQHTMCWSGVHQMNGPPYRAYTVWPARFVMIKPCHTHGMHMTMTRCPDWQASSGFPHVRHHPGTSRHALNILTTHYDHSTSICKRLVPAGKHTVLVDGAPSCPADHSRGAVIRLTQQTQPHRDGPSGPTYADTPSS